MTKIKGIVLMTIVTWTSWQCKHTAQSELRNVQVLGDEGAVYAFLYDQSTSPASVIVKQCEERALLVNNDCPEYPRNKTKAQTRMSLTNLKYELEKHSQKFKNELQRLSLTPESFVDDFMKHYVTDEGEKADLETVSSKASGNPKDKLYKKLIDELMKGGLQAALNDSYQVVSLAFSDASEGFLAISYCTSEIGKYCKAENSTSSANAPISEVQKALPAAFYTEVMSQIRSQGQLVTDGVFYNETLYAPNPWVEPTKTQIEFISELNKNLSKITGIIFTQGYEVLVGDKVEIYACNRIDRAHPQCGDKSSKPGIVSYENFEKSIYDMTMTCLKNRFSCHPGPYIEKTLEILKKAYAGDPNKFVSIRDVTDYAARELRSRGRNGQVLLVGKDRLIRFDLDASENKFDYFISEIFFYLFNPNYLPPIEIKQGILTP